MTDQASLWSSSTSPIDTDPTGSSSRMSLASSLLARAATLGRSSVSWSNSGMGGPTGFWTRATTAFPKAAGGSSLWQVLQRTPPERYSMKPRLAAWLLSRSAERGEPLWREVRAALIPIAARWQPERSSSDRPTPGAGTAARSAAPTIPSRLPPATSSTSSPRAPGRPRSTPPSTGQRPGPTVPRTSSSPSAGVPKDSTSWTPSEGFWDDEEEGEEREPPWELDFGVRIVPDVDPAAFPPVWVRRLTPTECERLQGLPDGWTIAAPGMIERYGLSTSTPLDGTSSDGRSRFRSRSGSPTASGASSRPPTPTPSPTPTDR